MHCTETPMWMFCVTVIAFILILTFPLKQHWNPVVWHVPLRTFRMWVGCKIHRKWTSHLCLRARMSVGKYVCRTKWHEKINAIEKRLITSNALKNKVPLMPSYKFKEMCYVRHSLKCRIYCTPINGKCVSVSQPQPI